MKTVHQPDLKKMSTLKLGGRARAALYPENELHLEEINRNWAGIGLRCMYLGKGSNVLFTEDNRDLVLVKWKGRILPESIAQDRDRVLVLVDAGYPLPRLLGWCASRGLSGLEGLAGIPGSVGGAITMNAGSHGVEICSLLTSIWIWTPEKGTSQLQTGQFSYGYRWFNPGGISGNPLVTAAEITLVRSSPQNVQENIKRFYLRKKRSQPVLASTAGCVFKNPPDGEPAGKLLERAGFRGRQNKGVAFSSKHANFLVNLGHGSSTQALDLIAQAREKVFELSGHELQLEIKTV
ncbi:UDP-N-acetylmuramate dehydrogenase [Desulfonatronospira sp.]|uniref:UDP-N-acetylmuramate dehydrogenase n=1 Tax=Desulfonatronospira sp. TaxID=1962951 RepID=UPI0025BD4147|nr:UDP-N-acetylmuramate dehydrogenase [Desulfonatronospira sp.]